MIRSAPNRLPRLVSFAALVLMPALPGCRSGTEGGLLDRHLADNRGDDARRRWEAIRGDVKLQVARQHFRAGRYVKAEAELREVLALAPEEIGVYQLAARLYLEQGRLVKARETIDRALTLPGRDAETEYLAGIVAQRYGEFERALEHYLTAQSMAPSVAEYVLAVAETDVALGRLARALDFIEPRIADFDGCVPLRVLAARINRMIGLKGPAVAHCHAAIQQDDHDTATDVEIGLILFWADRYEDAIALLRPHVERRFLRPDRASNETAAGAAADEMSPDLAAVDRSVAVTLARAYLARGQWAAAMAVLKPLMSDDAADPTAWCLFCRAALLAGDLNAAGEAADTFNRRNPPTAETLLLQAYIAHRQGDHALAERAASRALQLDGELDAARWIVERSARLLGRRAPPAPPAPDKQPVVRLSRHAAPANTGAPSVAPAPAAAPAEPVAEPLPGPTALVYPDAPAACEFAPASRETEPPPAPRTRPRGLRPDACATLLRRHAACSAAPDVPAAPDPPTDRIARGPRPGACATLLRRHAACSIAPDVPVTLDPPTDRIARAPVGWIEWSCIPNAIPGAPRTPAAPPPDLRTARITPEVDDE